ncbi:MAG: hypothetical protein WBA10_08495 [Elainellaceae cyanobacterium]
MAAKLNILADIAKVLLDNQNQNYEAFTPITMELPEDGGIEPDYQNLSQYSVYTAQRLGGGDRGTRAKRAIYILWC